MHSALLWYVLLILGGSCIFWMIFFILVNKLNLDEHWAFYYRLLGNKGPLRINTHIHGQSVNLVSVLQGFFLSSCISNKKKMHNSLIVTQAHVSWLFFDWLLTKISLLLKICLRNILKISDRRGKSASSVQPMLNKMPHYSWNVYCLKIFIWIIV